MSVTIVTTIALHLASGLSGVADAANPEKVWICHGTASEVRPYNLIHVKESEVEGHLDGTAPGNHGEDNQKNPDFLWDVEGWDADCEALEADPLRIWSSCGGNETVEDLETITFDALGVAYSDFLTCPSVHGIVELPTGTTHVRCEKGTVTTPYWHTYYLDDLAFSYGVRCVDGDVVNLGVQGGPFQVTCPAEGYIELLKRNFFGGLVPTRHTCSAGAILPNASSTFPDTTLGWAALGTVEKGYVRCPASGTLDLYFTQYGTPATSTDVFTSVSCTPGLNFDLTTAANL